MNSLREIYSDKFEFDTENGRAWVYEGNTKIELDQSAKSDGKFNYQVVWALDEKHKDFWINYTLTYSQQKSWINVWYKKKIEDSSELNGFRHLHYKKKVATEDKSLIIVQFDYRDEMVQVWDKEKNKHRFVNRLKWDEQQRNSGQN